MITPIFQILYYLVFFSMFLMSIFIIFHIVFYSYSVVSKFLMLTIFTSVAGVLLFTNLILFSAVDIEQLLSSMLQ